MSVVLVNNFTAQTQYTTYLTVESQVQVPLQFSFAKVVPKNVGCTLFFACNTSGVDFIGPNVTPVYVVFGDDPITKTIYYEVGASFVIFAWLLFNPSTGVAFIIPNTLLSNAFNNAFGCPAPSLNACAGFYSETPAAVVPGVPFLMSPESNSNDPISVTFEQEGGHVNLTTVTFQNTQFSKLPKTQYFTVANASTVSDEEPLSQWTGILKVVSTGRNALVFMNQETAPQVYALNSTSGEGYTFVPMQSNLDTTTIPGFLNSGFPSLVNLKFEEILLIPLNCGLTTNFGCKLGENVCQVKDTTAGLQLCNQTLKAALSDAPPMYNIVISHQIQTQDLFQVQVVNDSINRSQRMACSEPVMFTNIYQDITVNIMSPAASDDTAAASITSVLVSSDMAPSITAILYKLNNFIEFGAVISWFDVDRQTVFVNITPQTLAGYFPLYGFLPCLYTVGGSPMLPATYYTDNSTQIGVGEGFSMTNILFDPDAGTYQSVGTTPSTFVLLTNDVTGLLTLNFVPASGGSPVRMCFDSTTNYLRKYDPTADAAVNEIFGVLNSGFSSTSEDSTSVLLSAVAANTGITYYYVSLTSTKITRNAISDVGGKTWNWTNTWKWNATKNAVDGSASPGLINQACTVSDPALAVNIYQLGTTYTDTFYRSLKGGGGGGGPSAGGGGDGGGGGGGGGGPSAGGGRPAAAGPGTAVKKGTKLKTVTTPIPTVVKTVGIVVVVVVVLSAVILLILANT